MQSYPDKLEKIKPLARQAGALVSEFLHQNKQVEYKTDINLVTVADKKSEEFLVAGLAALFPEDSILAEEGNSRQGSSGYSWVIDPIDGTTSFVHGFPFFAISIGLVDHHSQPVLGVVYNPFFDEMFAGARGCGAFVNDQPLSVSRVGQLKDSLLGTGFPYNRREIMPMILERLGRVLFQVHDVRRTGSASLDICYVASGRLDGYFEQGLQPWDVAAALAILHEAGGASSKFDGSPADIFVPEMVASNRHIHGQLVELLQKG